MGAVKDVADDMFSLAEAQETMIKTQDTLIRRFAKAANSVDGYGKTWTMFSRILSGSPLWRLQNYVRALGQALDGVMSRNEKAIQQTNEQMKAFSELTNQMSQVNEQLGHLKGNTPHAELMKLNQEYKNTFEALQAAGVKPREAQEKARTRAQAMYDATFKALNKNLKREGKSIQKSLERQQAYKDSWNKRALKKELKQAKKERKEKFKLAKHYALQMREYERKQRIVKARLERGEGREGDEEKLKEYSDISYKAQMRGRKAAMAADAALSKRGELQERLSKVSFVFIKRVSKFMAIASAVIPLFKVLKKGLIDMGFRKLLGKGWDSIKKASNVMRMVGKNLLAYTGYFLLFLAGAFLVFEAIKQIVAHADFLAPIIEMAKGVLEGLLTMFSGVTDIFKAFFGSGSFGERMQLLLDGVIKLFSGLGTIIFSALKGAVKLALTLIIGVVVIYWKMLSKIASGIVAFFSDPMKHINNAVKKISEWFQSIDWGALAVKIGEKIMEFWTKFTTWMGNTISGFMDGIPFFANGGVSAGGLAVVGEKGPELVNLSRGTKVYSNTESKKMVGGGGGNTVINVSVNGRVGASDSELRDIARKVGRMVSAEINRSTSSSTNVRY